MFDPFVVEIYLHDVHEMGHLGEDENSMTEFFEFGEDTVNEFELSRRTVDPIMVADVIIVFKEHIWMVATLPQLHHQVG